MSDKFVPVVPIAEPDAPLQNKDSSQLMSQNATADIKSLRAVPALFHLLDHPLSEAAVGANSTVRPSVEQGDLKNRATQQPPSSLLLAAFEEHSLREQLLANDSLGG